MGDLIDLETEFIIGRVRLLHAVDLGIEACFQLSVPVFHSIDVLICGGISRGDHGMAGTLQQSRAASQTCRNKEKHKSDDPDDQEGPAVADDGIPYNRSRF